MKLNCEYIKNLRVNTLGKNNKSLTKEELSLEIDLPTVVISRMESNEGYCPTICSLNKLATYFNVSIDSFILR